MPKPVEAPMPRLVASAVSRWWDDPYARGAWSLLRPGSMPDTRATLGRPIGHRLIIAGEATHPQQAGMVHGAFEEGQRAARWVREMGHRSAIGVYDRLRSTAAGRHCTTSLWACCATPSFA